MAAAAKQIIVVLGATGSQGGALVKAALADGTFAVRAVTRKVDSDKAKALAAQGVEVVAADLNDVPSLAKAFEGAYGVFAVTNYWEIFSVDVELQQAKNIADAAKAAGVKQVVWSTLEDTRPTKLDVPLLHGKYKVPHFDGKGEANAYFLASGVPTTLYFTSFYLENLIGFGLGPKRQADGTLLLTIPWGTVPIPVIVTADIGKIALGIFKAGDEFKGKSAAGVTAYVTGQQLADLLSEGLGEKVTYAPFDPQVFAKFGFPGADDMGNMFSFFQDGADVMAANRPIAEASKLAKLGGGDLVVLKDWVAANKEALLGAIAASK